MRKKRSKHPLNAIQPGYELHWYEIREILGQGGFGITYLAYDQNLAHEVAIKEYLPVDLATRAADGTVIPVSHDHVERYRWGLDRFIEEARTIGQFKHPNIVRVRNVFQANNTAYMVMDYELGESLQEILSRRKVLDESDIATVLYPIIDGVKLVHAHGFIHRDIKPGNIFIRVDGDPVLLDFGSARQAMEQSRANLTSLFSKGYAPIEQYNSQEEQGPWTDIYALGATMYRAIAGVPPADAVDRSSAISIAGRDTYVPALEVGEGRYSRALLEAIDYAMKFKRQDRPQSIAEWQQVLYGRSSAEQQHRESAGAAADAAAAATTPLDHGVAALQAELFRAERGEADAQFLVGYRCAKGIDVAVDEARAVHWFQKAAAQGHVQAQYNLGVMYSRGRGVAQDYAQALTWYSMAAEQGDVAAQAVVAAMYAKGVGTPVDQKAAFDWYLNAARHGHLNAMHKLGEIYMHGAAGVKRDPREAFNWFQRAAEKGHVNAQLNVGFMYGKGEGVERDDARSVYWYRRAAEAGNPNAQYNLGLIYAKGRGVICDLDEARKWYTLAADQGEPNAVRALARWQRN